MASETVNQSDIATEQEFKREDVQQNDGSEMVAAAISGDKIKELMNSQGPTVKAVLLKTDGTAQEVLYDTTPSRNHAAEILGAPPSIIGQYIDLDVIVVGQRCDDTQPALPQNQHKLRYPFNTQTIHGDVFLYRFNQDCVMKDFPLTEYQQFASKSHEDIGKVFKPDVVEDDDDDEQYEEDEYDEEEQLAAADEFMREIVRNKVIKEFPTNFGREPTDEEIEDMVEATLMSFGSMMTTQQVLEDVLEDEEVDAVPDQKDDDVEDDEEDDDYNPEEDAEQETSDQVEDVLDDEQFENDKKEIEDTMAEYDEEPRDDLDEDEEKLINSQEFADEFRAAIDNVQRIAKEDRLKILEMVKQTYQNDTGMEPTDDMLADAFKMFSIDPEADDVQNNDGDNAQQDEDGDVDVDHDDDNKEDVEQEADSEEEEEIDPQQFAKEMNEALDNVRNLGRSHGQELIGQIARTYAELNGVGPNDEQLQGIMSNIKEQLADEAREDFIDANAVRVNVENLADDDDDGEHEQDEVDEDEVYEPNEEDFRQIQDDKKIEVLEQLVEQNEDGKRRELVSKKVKVLITPVKQKPAGSRVDIYLDDQSDSSIQQHNLETASAKFKRFNGRDPTDEDKQRLAEFVKTGLLFESEVDTQIVCKVDDDDEDDEEYDPTKDTYDYTQDVDDDLEDDEEVNENDDTSNMIDID